MKTLGKLIFLVILFSCNQRIDNKSPEENNELQEVDKLENKINSLVLSAKPYNDTVTELELFENYFSKVRDYMESSTDSLVIIKSKEILDNQNELLSLYYKKVDIANIRKGTITTIADGYDVGKVNVWSSTDGSSRTIRGYFIKGDKVDVIESDGPYYLVYSKSKNLKGFLMKGFVVNIK